VARDGPTEIRKAVRRRCAGAQSKPPPRRPGSDRAVVQLGSRPADRQARRSFGPHCPRARRLFCGDHLRLPRLWRANRVTDLKSQICTPARLPRSRLGPRCRGADRRSTGHSPGKVIGPDVIPELLALARRNAVAAGVDNVEFVGGYLEDIASSCEPTGPGSLDGARQHGEHDHGSPAIVTPRSPSRSTPSSQ